MSEDNPMKVTVRPDGPYVVTGSVPLRRKTPVMSEDGEPLVWRHGDIDDSGPVHVLCRCGASGNKPYCDGAHAQASFDGTETAPTNTLAARSENYPGTGIDVFDDRATCVHAGFCGNKVTNVWKMAAMTDDTTVRAQVMGMIENCPSGALTYAVDGAINEPGLPAEIGIIADGPIFVTGRIGIERSDGEPLETRNRVTLCRCGASSNKPLCDGSHTSVGFTG